jgi:hypothetical protein
MYNPPINVTTLIKRECFRDHGLLDETLYGTDDYEFWLRIAEDYDFVYIPEPLVVKREHGNNASNDIRRITADRRKIAEKYRDTYPYVSEAFSRRISEINLKAAKSEFVNGQYLRSIRYLMKAVTADSIYAVSRAYEAGPFQVLLKREHIMARGQDD